MNLRYRYYVWLERKLDSISDELDDTPESLRSPFKPQDEYDFGEQFLLFIAVPMAALWLVGVRVRRFFESLEIGEKLIVRKATNVDEETKEINKP